MNCKLYELVKRRKLLEADVIGLDVKVSPRLVVRGWWRAAAQMARDHNVTLVGGSVPETSDGHLYNTCCVYGPDGSLLGKHRKVDTVPVDNVTHIQYALGVWGL